MDYWSWVIVISFPIMAFASLMSYGLGKVIDQIIRIADALEKEPQE